MKTRHLSVFELEEAALLLRAGEVVAFPTETVYGLGANALSTSAVEKIFQAKGRPTDNPLIVHLSATRQLSSLCREIPMEARHLIDRLWPGPLTIVLPKRDEVPDIVTAGLDSVAVRFPNHPLALELIERAGLPLAAPSANLSGRPSATTWQAVAEDLDGRISAIICGEPTLFGLESTVVDATCNPFRVLRPGGVSLEQLHAICPNIQPYSGTNQEGETTDVKSPGLKHKHYQPKAKVCVVRSAADFAQVAGVATLPSAAIVHYIGLNRPIDPQQFAVIRVCTNVHEFAAHLFDFFRQADSNNADFVCCEEVQETGIGVALMDRLRRASQ